MIGDGRSRRVAIVADALLNDPAAADDLDALVAADWGLMQLPATDLAGDVRMELLALLAEQVDEYQRHGYEVVAHPSAGAADLAAVEARCRTPIATAG